MTEYKSIEELEDGIHNFINKSDNWSVAMDRYTAYEGNDMNDQAKMIDELVKELAVFIVDTVGILTKGNQSGGSTQASGAFFQAPNSEKLISVQNQKIYNAFIEWLDAMGWLNEFNGQEKSIFEWFLPHLNSRNLLERFETWKYKRKYPNRSVEGIRDSEIDEFLESESKHE